MSRKVVRAEELSPSSDLLATKEDEMALAFGRLNEGKGERTSLNESL